LATAARTTQYEITFGQTPEDPDALHLGPSDVKKQEKIFSLHLRSYMLYLDAELLYNF
jgi:hypothetical protein